MFQEHTHRTVEVATPPKIPLPKSSQALKGLIQKALPPSKNISLYRTTRIPGLFGVQNQEIYKTPHHAVPGLLDNQNKQKLKSKSFKKAKKRFSEATEVCEEVHDRFQQVCGIRINKNWGWGVGREGVLKSPKQRNT